MKSKAVASRPSGAVKIPMPFGNVRDGLSFYSALVPRQKSSVAPKALVPIVDCMLLNKGRLVRWLCTGDEGEATEKLSTDKEALLRVFRQKSAFLLLLI